MVVIPPSAEAHQIASHAYKLLRMTHSIMPPPDSITGAARINRIAVLLDTMKEG